MTSRPIDSLPNALEHWSEVEARRAGRRPAVFLDYDGTLTPIVERPEDAHLPPEMREVLQQVAAVCPVAVVSGRDVSFIIDEVALDDVIYLGSHGFDVVAPEGVELSMGREDEFSRFLGPLDDVQKALEEALDPIPGARIERKKYAVAVHYRQAGEADVPAIERIVDEQTALHPGLRKSGGKKVFELRPDIDWDKGRAVRWVMDALGLPTDATMPVYIGDDLTDEDAFTEIGEDGLTVVVGSGSRETVAAYAVPSVDDVREVLLRIAAMAKEV